MDRKDSKASPGSAQAELGPATTHASDERLEQIFNEKFREWRHALASLQERLCRDLVSVAVANREAINGDPLDWVREQVESFWKARRAVFRNWAILGCDSKIENEKWPEVGWLAPCFLRGQILPESLPGLAVLSMEDEPPPAGRLSSSYTKEILSIVSARIEMQLSVVAKHVLDKATISLASERGLIRLNPGQAVESLDKALLAIASTYSQEWARLMAAWITIDSSSGLYTALHPGSERAPEPAVQATRLGQKEADLEGTKNSTRIMGPRKHGPEAKMEFHRAIADVVRSFGPNWKEHLEQIARRLDKHKRKLPPSAVWANKNPSARSWGRAVAQYPDLVLKKLAYSLKMAARDPTH